MQLRPHHFRLKAEIGSGEAGHADIGDHQVDVSFAKNADRLIAVACAYDHMSRLPQDFAALGSKLTWAASAHSCSPL